MSNKLSTKVITDVISAVPKEVMTKYGWILLATPAICYGVDKFRGFLDSVVTNEYRIKIKCHEFEMALEKEPATA